MRALLHALSRDPARRRRRLALAVVSALAIAGGSLVAGRFAFSSGRELCHGADAALAGVWGVKERASLREVFGDFDRRYAENAGALVEAALDGYAGDWAAERVAACRDTHVRGLQTSEVLELRYACLDARLLRMQSLIENLKTLDVAHLEHAVEAARGLPSIAGCRDLATLRLELPPPDDERTRAEVESIRLALEEAKLKDQLGQFAAARAATEALVDRARATAYRPLLAEVLLELSLLQNMLGDRQDAATTREEALWLAEASGHDSVAAQAWIQEVNAAYRSSDFVGAHRALRRADAAIERAGDLAKLRDRYAFERGLLLLSEGKTAEAEAVFRELIDSRRRLFGPEHGDVGRAHSEVAVALMRQGRDGEALVEIEEAARIYNKFFGAGHPELGRVLANRAQALAGLHRSDEAIVALELAQENFVQSLGPEHAWVGSIENNLGLMQNYRDPGRARVHFLRALELLTLTYGETHYQSALVLNNLGGVECMLGDFTAAIAHQRRALEIREELLGPDHLEVSHMLDTLGTTYAAMGALEEATALYERSIALLERIDRADRSDVVYPLVRLASARLSEDRPAEARSLLERAMTIAEGSERIDEAWLAATRYWLAVTLTELAVERDRARSLAEKAFTYYEQPGIHRTRRIHDAAALLARLGDATAMTRLASVAPGDPPPWHACGI
ncbi:MAG: tetratricopeptide repeat protein [Myxococcales bacterium]|nr:tetratricopeptide repeat protein [Myxococcales bacterium]